MPGSTAVPKKSKNAVRYPGIPAVADGSEAVVAVESLLAQAAFASRTGPSSRMVSLFGRAAAEGGRNLQDEPLRLLTFDSGAQAGSACEGFAMAGGRAALFTAGQELLEMGSVLVSAAGKRLPLVVHVAARSLASQGLTVHAGHDDVMLLAGAGCGVLFAADAQEAADLALIARRAAELSETPFLCIQDAFLTTHGIRNVRLPEPDLIKVFTGAPSKRLRALFDSANPVISAPVQNTDSYMKGRIAQRFFFERVRPSLVTAMADYAELTGREYDTLRRYRMADAEYVLVGLGSLLSSAEAAVDCLRAKGVKAGALSVTCFRPFPAAEIVAAVSRCLGVAVIERTDTPLAESNPLVREIKSALAGAQMGDDARLLRVPEVYSGAAGLGGNEITAGHLIAAVENMQRFGRRFFALGIKHSDALPPSSAAISRPEGAFFLRCHSVGSYGAVETNRLLAAIAGAGFGLRVAAGSRQGAEENSSPVRCWLTAAAEPFQPGAEPAAVDLLAIENIALAANSGVLDGVVTGGAVYIPSELPAAQLWSSLPDSFRRTAREKALRVFTLPSRALAAEAGIPGLHGVALAGVVLKLAPAPLSLDGPAAFAALETAAARVFRDAAPACCALVRAAASALKAVATPELSEQTEDGARAPHLTLAPADSELVPSGFCDGILSAYAQGREASLEADLHSARSLVPPAASRFRSYRTLATAIPRFLAANCTGCMDCVNICPDSAICARVVEPESVQSAPETVRAQFAFTQKYYETLLKRGEQGGLFGLYVDPDRCKGCGECAEICAGRDALSMISKQKADLDLYDQVRSFFDTLPDTPARFLNEKSLGDVLLSGRGRLHAGCASSCAGCGESSALRMMLAVTGFFHGGDCIGVVAAPGCHQAAGASYPYTPYEVAWTNTSSDEAAATALGIRTRWDQQGFAARRLWVVGTDDIVAGAGFASLLALVRSGLNINVLVLDKGSRAPGTDLGSMLFGIPGVLVAQTTPAHVNHFHKSIAAANEFSGPSVIVSYASCIEGHALAEDRAAAQARMAVDARVFPMYVYDPRNGSQLRERLDLRGNPSMKSDWTRDPRTSVEVDPLTWARTEPRFASRFDANGTPDRTLEKAREDCLATWRRLQEMAGLR